MFALSAKIQSINRDRVNLPMSVFVVSIMAAAAKMNIFVVHNTYEKEQNSLYLKHTGRETFSNKKGEA